MEVEEQFRDAIESYLLGKYFSKFPIDAIAGGQVVKILNLQAAQLHKSEYEKLKIKLKRYINSQTTSDGIAQNYEHAGAYVLPKRPNDSGAGTILSIAGIGESYTKYAYYKIAAAGTITPTIEIGYTGLSCEVVGDVITLTSSAEFVLGTQLLPSNWDATWTYDSVSQYTITLPDGWETDGVSFEVYLRS
jgi:hypothetical protein